MAIYLISLVLELTFASLHQTQTRLVVNNISLISAQAQESQSYTNKQVERALRELTAHLTLLNNMLDDHASLRSILQRTLSNTQQVRARTPGSHTHTGIDVKAYMPATPERRCDFYYRFKCHIIYSLRSTPLLKGLIGSLFISYSKNPFCLASRCNITSCQGQVIFGAHVRYYFPY